MQALLALVRTDLVLYFSNRRAILITLAAPILIAAFFGSVMGGGPKKPASVPIAVVNQDTGDFSRRFSQSLASDPSFSVQSVDAATATRLVREGKVRAAVGIPPGFGDAAMAALLSGGKRPQIALQFDPSQATTVPMVNGLLAQHVVQSLAAGSPMKSMSLPFDVQQSEVTAEGEARNYNAYAHSFAGMGVQFVLFMGIEIGVGLLLARRMGLWKRLRAAPLSRGTLLGSRIVSGTLIAMILMLGIYAAAMVFFGVRVQGSIAGFFGVLLGFSLLASSFGMLIAAFGRTPEATRGIAILATLLLVMLGGAWVPTFIFPEWLQQATLVVPTRWAVDGLDGMTWRGLGFEAAAGPIAAMIACSAVFSWIAVKRFDWEE